MYKRKYSHGKNKVQTLSFLRFMCLNISYGSLLLWSIHVYVHTMPRRKGIRRDHTEAIVAAHQSGECYKTISKLFKVHHSAGGKIILNWKTFKKAFTGVYILENVYSMV